MTIREWPKKTTVREFADHGYTSCSSQTIINRIKKGLLPGEKDCGQWYVWVNADMSPAMDTPAVLQPVVSTGNAVADRILKKYRGNTDGEVAH